MAFCQLKNFVVAILHATTCPMQEDRRRPFKAIRYDFGLKRGSFVYLFHSLMHKTYSMN